jgi:cation transport ATPase
VPLGRPARPTSCGSRRPSSARASTRSRPPIVRAAEERGIAPGAAGDFRSVTGKGVAGTVDGVEVALGNRAMMEEAKVDVAEGRARSDELRREGATVMYVAAGGTLAGLVAVADPIKAVDARGARGLRRAGVRIVMLTGDNRTTAEAVARRLGIDEVEAEVLPEQKSAVVRGCRGRAAWWRWPATASTTRRPWPPRTSGSRWAPAPTWRSRAPA